MRISSVSFEESAVYCFIVSDLSLFLTGQRQLSRSAQPLLVGGDVATARVTEAVVLRCEDTVALSHCTIESEVLLCCRRREEQSVKLRKTAEKLLMNQLKKHALKNMSGSQQAAVFAQAKQTSAADPSPSDEVPADLLVRKQHIH